MSQDMSYKKRGKDPWKDFWRTPPAIFQAANERFQFTLDAAAAPETALCRSFITAEMDALVTPWVQGAALPRVWLNPPYSRTKAFTARCVDQSRAGALVAALVPNTTDVIWWHRDVFGVAAEVWLYTGRIAFIHPLTGEVVRGNKGGSQLIVWTPDGPGAAGTRFGTLCHRTGLPLRPEDRGYWQLAARTLRASLTPDPRQPALFESLEAV